MNFFTKNKKCYIFGIENSNNPNKPENPFFSPFPFSLFSLSSLSFLPFSFLLSLSLFLFLSPPPPASPGLATSGERRTQARRTRYDAPRRSPTRSISVSPGQIRPSPSHPARIPFVPARARVSLFATTFCCRQVFRSCTSTCSHYR